jgi:electron transfer flavoprotein alpha subunit
MSTVRPGIMKAIAPDNARKGEIIPIKTELFERDEPTKIVKVVNACRKIVNLEEAEIIVAAGRGIGKKENFKLVQDLANVLGCEIGASRAVVEAGWISADHQVGQTGKTVRPKLYIACGISGAIQHRAGMQSSEFIVAINKDPEAMIFKFADVGIVGDVKVIIPKLIEAIKEDRRER